MNAGNLYKYMEQCAGGFYNPAEILTYNRPWNFIIGSRNIGKSTGYAIYFILDYIINGHKFVYCRRTRDEVQLTCNTFFGNAVAIINKKCSGLPKIKEMVYSAGYYRITYEGRDDSEICGQTVALSLEQKVKSANFSDYYNLVYDEFIATDSARYLGTKDTPDREYNACLSLFQTMDRGIDQPFRNEVRFFFLGNNWTIYNPIFLSLNISDYVESDSKMIRPKNAGWLVQLVGEVEATKDYEQSNAFLLSDARNRDYAYRNKGVDSDTYISKMPQGAKKQYYYTLIYEGKKYGVYECQEKFYIGKYMNLGRPEIALDTRSHYANDLMMITSWLDFPLIQVLHDAFKHNRLFFETGRIKQSFYKFFRLMP